MKERAGTIAPCFREMAKVADDFFLLFFGDLTCQQMENVSINHANGTFKIVPKKFYQLLIKHCFFWRFNSAVLCSHDVKVTTTVRCLFPFHTNFLPELQANQMRCRFRNRPLFINEF